MARLAQQARQPEQLIQQQLHSAAQCCRIPSHPCRTTARAIATHVATAAREQPLVGTAAGDVTSSNAQDAPDPEAPQHDLNTTTTSSSSETLDSDVDSSGSSSSEDSSDGAAVSAEPVVDVKVLSEARELDAVAKLRASAYYEHDRSRFAASFKKQFAAQEVESLRQRTAPTTSRQRPQLCDCLVAVDEGGSVVGCIDIRLPECYTNMKTIGVPDGDAAGCYLLNVVVAEEYRGKGVGKRVMRAAMQRAVAHWGAQRLYTHVEADNEVANRLYRSCGFNEHSSEAKYANTSSLGRLVLLMATADDAGQQ